MTHTNNQSALRAIAALGTPKGLLHIPLTGALYLQDMGGPAVPTYWSGPEVADHSNLVQKQRGELFLVVTSMLSLMRLYACPLISERQQEFAVAFLFLLKGFAQTAASVHTLSSAGCYLDALAVIRSLHGRVNLLALFALGPHLFDEWLKSPKEGRFLDGHIRDELANHKITIFPHLYEQFSEAIHGQYQALAETGYMQDGLFPKIIAIENQVLVASKLLFGVVGCIGLSVLALSPCKAIAADLKEVESLFAFVVDELLPPNRWDHLFTTIAEDRHWRMSGKDKTTIAEWFDQTEFRRQVELFARKSRPKELGKPYRKARASGPAA